MYSIIFQTEWHSFFKFQCEIFPKQFEVLGNVLDLFVQHRASTIVTLLCTFTLTKIRTFEMQYTPSCLSIIWAWSYFICTPSNWSLSCIPQVILYLIQLQGLHEPFNDKLIYLASFMAWIVQKYLKPINLNAGHWYAWLLHSFAFHHWDPIHPTWPPLDFMAVRRWEPQYIHSDYLQYIECTLFLNSTKILPWAYCLFANSQVLKLDMIWHWR